MIEDPLTVAMQRARRRGQLPPPAVRRHLRERVGISQRDLATAIGVDRVSVSRYESGSRSPRGAIVDRYLVVLDRLAREGLGS